MMSILTSKQGVLTPWTCETALSEALFDIRLGIGSFGVNQMIIYTGLCRREQLLQGIVLSKNWWGSQSIIFITRER